MISSKFSSFLWAIDDAIKTGIAKTQEEQDYLIKYLFAKEFGWTPDTVNNLSYRDVLVFMKMIEVVRREEELKMKEAEAKSFV